jgi:WhiB family redox-sensing transcriptional regulator
MSIKEPWLEQAVCTSMTDMFFPSEEHMGKELVLYRKAKEICSRCPVAKQCLDYAIKNQIFFGVWGNTTPKERKALYTQSLYFSK